MSIYFFLASTESVETENLHMEIINEVTGAPLNEACMCSWILGRRLYGRKKKRETQLKVADPN